MRNVFQAIPYIEVEIVRNMLEANGIPSTYCRVSDASKETNNEQVPWPPQAP